LASAISRIQGNSGVLCEGSEPQRVLDRGWTD
jgi:hypothetical protein